MEWSKVESRCPSCKQRFLTIVKPSVPGISRSRPRIFHIPHKDQVYQPSEEEIRLFTDPYLDVVCSVCQEAGDEGVLLLCDGCDSAAHTYCVGLGLSVPRGDWFCNACSIEHRGFSTDDDDEVNNEAEENDSTPLLTFVIANVQPVPRRQRPRRSTAYRSNQVGRRHTRLHPFPALSEEAQALAIQEENLSGSLIDDVESTQASARTLSSQRIIRQRVNDFRNHWDQLRRGELQFGSISHSAPRTRASQAGRNQSSAIAPAAPSNDISQAWAMMELARTLRADRVASNSAPTTRTVVHRETTRGRIPTIEGTSMPSSRFSQAQEPNLRTDSARDGNQAMETRPMIQIDQNQEQNSRRENTRDTGCLIANRLRSNRDRAHGHDLRNDVREGNYSIESSSRGRRGNGREGSHAVDGRSNDHGGGRISGRRDMNSVHDIQDNSVRELRSFRNSNDLDGEGRNAPGSSGGNERPRVVGRIGRRSQLEDQQAPTPRTRGSSRERRETKEQVAHYVKAELKPLYHLGHIDKEEHNRIARSATQEFLSAFGIECRVPETRASENLSTRCTHSSPPSTFSIFPISCLQCVKHNVSKIVGVLVKKAVGKDIL